MWRCQICDSKYEDSVSVCPIDGNARPVPPPNQVVPKAGGNVISGQQHRAEPRTAPKPPDEREQLRALENKKQWLQAGVILCICTTLALFAASYIDGVSSFTVYKNIQGLHGDIEQVCSIVALFFTLLPAPFMFMKLDVHKRSLPFAISAVSGAAMVIYCCVIYFGSIAPNKVMLIIVLAQACGVYFSHLYVKMVARLENFLFKSSLRE